jgi:site-specific DNA-methyltransferase (adenine-specific)
MRGTTPSKADKALFSYSNTGSSNSETKVHPTQKPVALYSWLLSRFAKPGDRILDTHGGSMSSVIACLNLGFEVTCCELDPDYFASAVKRIENTQRQQPMFAPLRAKQIQTVLV